MKIVFMGTPEYSVPTLQALLDSEHEVVAVYTKPDMPKGRGKKVEVTPIKAMAQSYRIPVYQPKTFKEEEAVTHFMQHQADIAVVIAYGLILPPEVLNAYPKGCINLHASLLPKFRGASPIQAAILAGETKTGVTSMQMDAGLDTGNMLLASEILLDDTITAGELHDVLAGISAKVCLDTLKGLAEETIIGQVQPEDGVSYAGKITKEMGKIHWEMPSAEIDRTIRGMNPWPSAYTFWNGKILKIWDAESVVSETVNATPGEILRIDEQGLEVACGKGSLWIRQVQLEGKKRMNIVDFLNGHNMMTGQFFK